MKLFISIILFIFTHCLLSAHCQVPCGIYDDESRVVQMFEDLKTIEKAIVKINDLSKHQSTSQDINQLVRWVETKEEHAQNIQNIISTYFLAQRIKPKEKGEKAYKKYVSLVSSCQKIIFHTMKCKQNTDLSHTKTLRLQFSSLIENYFDKKAKANLKELFRN
tara:strand:- start:12480 stop:12968 length:489 start_codon:yes stop_codon:yes gene_type:complete